MKIKKEKISKEELLELIISKNWTLGIIKELVLSPMFPSDLFEIADTTTAVEEKEIYNQLNDLQPQIAGCFQKLISFQRLIADGGSEYNKLKKQQDQVEEKINLLEAQFYFLLNKYRKIIINDSVSK
jgi:peptidoglycan hydrolase CwlO-like protein